MIRVVSGERREPTALRFEGRTGFTSDIWVGNRIVIGVEWPEETGERVLHLIFLTELALGFVVEFLPHSVFVHLIIEHASVLDHGRLRLEVRSGVPFVLQFVGVGHVVGEQETANDAEADRIASEELLSMMIRFHDRVFFADALVRHNTNASLVSLHPVANHASDGPAEHGTSREPLQESKVVLVLHSSNVLDGHTLWSGHQLAWSIGDPPVRLDVVLQPDDCQ